MTEPWNEDTTKQIELGLIKVKVSNIVEYPDCLGGDTCIHLRKAKKLGLYIPGDNNSKKTIQQVLEESAQSQEKIKQCMKAYCGGLYKVLTGKARIRNTNDYVVLAEYRGKYYPYGNGHHRICIAKRTKLEYIEAEVFKIVDC